MATLATLAGEPLLASQPVGWSLVAGVRPHTQDFLMEAGAANRVFNTSARAAADDKPLPVKLVIRPDNFPELAIDGLYILSTSPTASPHTLAVTVADARIWWTREHIARAYNVRRKTGDRRILVAEGQPEALAQVADDVHYAPWSLFPRESPATVWEAADVLKDILEVLAGENFNAPDEFPNELPVEGLQLDDAGPEALQRVLGLLPGMAIYVDAAGKIQVYNRRDNSERGVIEATGPALVGSLLPAEADLSISRPKQVDVLFTREIEMRFDTRIEGAATVSQDIREMENVAPVPDFTLEINGKTVPQGTWARMDDLFTAWKADRRPGQAVDLDHDIIQKTWMVPGFLQAMIQATTDPDPILARRISTARANYRTTYRIDRKFLDRLQHLRAYRVAFLDTENGTRAPAALYSDWTVFYTIRGIGKSQTDGLQRLSNTTEGYADRLADARVAPANVSIIDNEQGVIRLQYSLDNWGNWASVVPGAITGVKVAETPEADPRMERDGQRGSLFQESRLKAGHRAAVVLTCIPGSPNTDERFQRIEVKPTEAEEKLGRSIGPCRGPRWEIRIGQSMETARIAWTDDDKDEIEKAIGLFAGQPDLEPVNMDRMEEIAKAAAAQLYSTMLDRPEGAKTVALDPTVKPTGSITGVSHSLAPDGRATTSFVLPTELEPIGLTAMMPESMRRRVLGLVDIRDD